MNPFVLTLMVLCFPGACIAQEVLARISGSSAKRVSSLAKDDAVDILVDKLRQHLVFVFDGAQHHGQPDSQSKWKPTQAEILEGIEAIKNDSYLEMTLTTPTPISVEGREFLMKTMWVSIREEDWGTFDWMFRTNEGVLVALSGIEGYYNRQIGPILREVLDPKSEQDAP